MYPPECEYHRAESVPEAIELLEAHDDGDPALLAGGQGLVTAMKTGDAAPGVLVDIAGVESLRGVVGDAEGVTVGALTRHADLAASDPVRDGIPLLGATAGRVGDRQIRNRGTIGGNLAEAKPGADLPAAVLAARGTIEISGPDGPRTTDAGEFFTASDDPALGTLDVLTHVRFPRHDRGAYVKRTHPASGYALVGVGVALECDGGTVTRAGVAATGVAHRPIRLSTVEEAVVGSATAELRSADAADGVADDLAGVRLVDDAYASGDYRAATLSATVERALGRAAERSGGPS